MRTILFWVILPLSLGYSADNRVRVYCQLNRQIAELNTTEGDLLTRTLGELDTKIARDHEQIDVRGPLLLLVLPLGLDHSSPYLATFFLYQASWIPTLRATRNSSTCARP